jgi:acetoin utilization protein AcuC
VTQHGADCHLFDPLAHLEVTTAGMARAFALLDGIAHQHAGGRWLATGGGGYDVYRVVPRSWSLVWLAQAHREVPERLPPEWRERWAAHARRHAQHPIPDTLLDPAGTAEPEEPRLTAANARTIDRALEAHAAARGSSTNG